MIYCPFNEPYYLDIASEIIKNLLAEGHTVRIVRPTKSATVTEYYSSSLLRIFNRPDPGSVFIQDFEKLGTRQASTRSLDRTSHTINLLKGEPSFQTSLQSSLISFFSDSGPFNKVNQKIIKRKFLKVASDVFQQTSEAMKSEKIISNIYVPNGRYADQKAFLLAASYQNPNVITNFYEKGFTDGKYFLGPYSLHDRKKVQEILKLQEFSENMIEANSWFVQRQTNSARNEFIYSWEDNAKSITKLITSSKKAVLFNSSNDELASLGVDWNDSEWNSQWEAFEKISKYLISKDYDLVLRLHPNGINKSRREKRRESIELSKFRKMIPSIKIHKPDSKVSSYDLINSSNLVVVWNSTVGLEACKMGKPVVNLNAAEWDDFIPVLSIKSESAIAFFENNLRESSSDECLNFISGRMALDKNLGTLTYSARYLQEEQVDFFYRLAKALAGSRRFKFKYIFKSFFVNTNSRLYRFIKRIYFKTKIIGG